MTPTRTSWLPPSSRAPPGSRRTHGAPAHTHPPSSPGACFGVVQRPRKVPVRAERLATATASGPEAAAPDSRLALIVSKRRLYNVLATPFCPGRVLGSGRAAERGWRRGQGGLRGHGDSKAGRLGKRQQSSPCRLSEPPPPHPCTPAGPAFLKDTVCLKGQHATTRQLHAGQRRL